MVALQLEDRLAARELLAREHPGHWAEQRLGFSNEGFHWEWYELELRYPRLTVVAPREYAKTEVFSVASTSWFAERWPGSWQYLFADTAEQAEIVLERVVGALAQAAPELVTHLPRDSAKDVIFGNWSRVTVAGRGKKVRGAHPDRIVLDDILDDTSTATRYQRRKVETWVDGTMANMAHPGRSRTLGWGKLRGANLPVYTYPPTKIRKVGTPFHEADALMRDRRNRIYHFRRYTAEARVGDLVPGTFAVEAA